SAAFARAYAATGDPTYLYTRAQAERSAGHCDVAIELYEEFIATGPSPQAELAARRYMEDCRAKLPSPQPAPVPEDDPVAPEPLASSEPSSLDERADEPPAPRPWFRDPLGDVLVGVGVAAAVTGGALVGVAYRDAGGAESAGDDRAFGQALDRAQTLERAGAVTLGIGGALIIGGVVRWALVARAAKRTQVGLGPQGLVVRGWLPSRGLQLTERTAAATRRATVPARFRNPRRPR
ncbi:MAG: hypothetical protein AAF721_38640, partial [Myxococcota bacterium]